MESGKLLRGLLQKFGARIGMGPESKEVLAGIHSGGTFALCGESATESEPGERNLLDRRILIGTLNDLAIVFLGKARFCGHRARGMNMPFPLDSSYSRVLCGSHIQMPFSVRPTSK